MTGSIEQRLKALEAKVQNIVRVGVVSVQDDAGCRVRVTFPDRENLQSNWLPVLVHNTEPNSDYWMPEVGEHVLCVFLPTGLEAGFVLGGYYVEGVTRPAGSSDVRVVQFADGGRVEYDRKKGRALVLAPTLVQLHAPEILQTGDVFITGKLHVNDEVYIKKAAFARGGVWPLNPASVAPSDKPEGGED